MANLNDKLVDYKSLKENTKLTLGEALAYDKGLAGGYNGDFPLTVATKGNIYRVPATNKFYMCITNYNGSNLTAPNANFEELSVWANRDKLENLPKIIDFGRVSTSAPKIGDILTINFSKKFNSLPIIIVGQNGYFVNNSVSSSSLFVITEITLINFSLKVIQNPNNHSPEIFWAAINN